MAGSLWCYLHFPLLPLEARYTDQACSQAAALLDERGTHVLLCNAAATAQGVSAGMAIATAYSLAPELRCYTRHPEQEPGSLEALAMWAGRFSAQISLYPPYGLLLEADSMLHYFGGLSPYLAQLHSALDTLHWSAEIATGHTPLAAKVLAETGGFTAEEASAHCTRLERLPIRGLNLEQKVIQRLEGMGIQHVKQLRALPSDALTRRFGKTLPRYLAQLFGEQPDPPRYFTPPKHFTRHLILPHELEHSGGLRFPLRRLLAEMEGYLRQCQLSAQETTLTLRLRDLETQELQVRHSRAELQASVWMPLWELRLERVRLTQPVIEITLRAQGLAPLEVTTTDLFNSATAVDTPEHLVSKLQTRLGIDAVQRMVMVADHRPEKSYRWVLPDSRCKEVHLPPSGARPHWLLPKPAGLAAAEITQWQPLCGPERIVGGWWDNLPVRRDYYIARSPDGRLGWIFRDANRQWYLHGWFG
ncbi:Y-family DNA polymerase [Neptunomonas marina]|uniref:DNA polymerase Y family protein n=1 Tax=Neptunomonas marina TaxID=1815562 RepID=A0A437QAK0_9GAMM|nr:DNA polymerase Y family protein [Neptunomonas marina]RVU31439.1 DNA polymerase Y family protein [Neptunomonas marina]